MAKQDQSRRARLEAIRRVIAERAVATQEELGELLAREGYRVTQATLSRDLSQLGAARAPRPGGGAAYSLESGASGASAAPARLREMGEQFVALDYNDALVVIRTTPGLASAVALAIDAARLPECLGTLAGDDTVFATPSRGEKTRALARRLRALFGKEDD